MGIYLDRWKGWPDVEMRGYYKAGFSPLEAYDAATSKRHKPANLVLGGEEKL